MARGRILLVALALLGGVGAPGAHAREEAAPAAALPAPAAEHAWEFSGYVLRDGRPYGRVTLSAGPDPEMPAHWRARDEIVPLRAQDFAVLTHAVLDRGLRARSGTYHRRNTNGFLRASFERTEAGYRLEHVADYYENRLDVPGAPGLTTLAGLVTLLRHLPADAAVHAVRDFDPDPSAGDPYVLGGRLEVHGIADWVSGDETRSAWIVSYQRGKQTLRLALDPETRALLGVVYIGLGVQLVPEGRGPGGLARAGSRLMATPLELAVARTAEIRRRLPPPARPLTLRGRLQVDGYDLGSFRVWAEPASHLGLPAWRFLESRRLQVGAGTIEFEHGGFLARDLSALRGERIDERPEGTFHVTYARRPGGMETIAHGPEGAGAPVLLGAPTDAVAGLTSVLLFLRAVPPVAAHYVLPGWDPRHARKPKAGTGTFSLSRSDLHVAVRPDASSPRRLEARCERRDGTSFTVRVELRPRRRTLDIRGGLPALDYLPGAGRERRVDWYDRVEGSPATWRQAFVKFGRGYHLPRRDLLADAFHWPSMLEHAVATGRYPEGTSEERVRADWIEVFVGMSKHRSEGDCDDLLFQIFATSAVTEHEDGAVTLRTLPAYGGHAYRLERRGPRWWIVQID